jgi:hypothetical protein
MSAAEIPNSPTAPAFQANINTSNDLKSGEPLKTVTSEMTKSDGSKIKRIITHNPEINEGTEILTSGFDKLKKFMVIPEKSKTAINASIDKDSHSLQIAEMLLLGSRTSAEEILDDQGQKISAEELLKNQGREVSAEEIIKDEFSEKYSKE